MSPPGQERTEVPIPAAKPVSGDNLPRIPRKWVKDAIEICMDLGYTVTGAEAWRLIKDFRDWRRGDVREFIADDFRRYLDRRGDIIRIRSKPRAGWRVT